MELNLCKASANHVQQRGLIPHSVWESQEEWIDSSSLRSERSDTSDWFVDSEPCEGVKLLRSQEEQLDALGPPFPPHAEHV